MNSTAATNAILLVGAGFLGVIASSLTGTLLFGLAGYVAFLLAISIGVGALVDAVREGFNTPHEPPKNAPTEPVKRKRVVDPYANVPY